MCFAPQRRALFRHLNFQKWSEPLVFCTFWLRNVLRATTACTFSSSQLPKVVRQWCALYILTSKCASRHNGVQFFISHLASWLRTRRFSEPTFRPSGAPNHWKNTVFRDFPTFSRICIFFLLTLSLLSASALLCFSSVHIVGSLTSKLPSINICICMLYNWLLCRLFSQCQCCGHITTTAWLSIASTASAASGARFTEMSSSATVTLTTFCLKVPPVDVGASKLQRLARTSTVY